MFRDPILFRIQHNFFTKENTGLKQILTLNGDKKTTLLFDSKTVRSEHRWFTTRHKIRNTMTV